VFDPTDPKPAESIEAARIARAASFFETANSISSARAAPHCC
jgi:hypothetical protein